MYVITITHFCDHLNLLYCHMLSNPATPLIWGTRSQCHHKWGLSPSSLEKKKWGFPYVKSPTLIRYPSQPLPSHDKLSLLLMLLCNRITHLYQIKTWIQAPVYNNGWLSSPKTQRHCVSLQCFPVWKKKKKAWHYRPFGSAPRKKGILHFNDIAHAEKQINDTVCG